MSNLIERLKEYSAFCGQSEQWEVMELVEETIAALSLVLPDEVEDILKGFRERIIPWLIQNSHGSYTRHCTEAADLIKRLYRENEQINNGAIAQARHDQQRIEELEDVVDDKETPAAEVYELRKAAGIYQKIIKDLKQRIEELDAKNNALDFRNKYLEARNEGREDKIDAYEKALEFCANLNDWGASSHARTELERIRDDS